MTMYSISLSVYLYILHDALPIYTAPRLRPIGFFNEPKMSERNELEPLYVHFNLKTIVMNKLSDM